MMSPYSLLFFLVLMAFLFLLQGTALPIPNVTPPSVPQPKTLPHALGRGAATASNALGPDQRLGLALKEYALAYDKIGAARLDQDDGMISCKELCTYHD